MKCDKCQSERVAEITAKCSDMCSYSLKDSKMHGNYYAPDDMGIGGGDYIEFNWCLECGKIQGDFPLPTSAIEKDITDAEVLEFYKNHFIEGDNIYTNLSDYKSGHYDMLAESEELGNKFASFIQNFIEHNNRRQPVRKYPPADMFLKMFKSGDADLPWDYVKKDFGID